MITILIQNKIHIQFNIKYISEKENTTPLEFVDKNVSDVEQPRRFSPSSTTATETPFDRQNWSQSYNEPWNKMSSKLLKALEKSRRLTPSLRRQMVRIIIDDVLDVVKKPKKK